MKKLVTLQNIVETSNKQRNKFHGCRKVFVMSPPRSASTLLSVMLNLNPKISIFCESCIQDLHRWDLWSIGRVAKLSNLTKEKCNLFLTTCKENNVTFEDIIIFIFSNNNTMRKGMESNCAIGDKTPQVTGKVEFIKQMNETFPNNFFPGVFKTDLSLILRSTLRTWINDGSNRADDIMIKDIIQFSTEMVNFVRNTKNYIENNKYNNVKIYDYISFVNNPGKLVDSMYDQILGNTNEFKIIEYSIDKYRSEINAILAHTQLGYLDHLLLIDKKKKRKLAEHQQGLLKEISKDAINYSDKYCTPIFDAACKKSILTDNINKYAGIMKEFPFAMSTNNYTIRPAFRNGVCIWLTGLSGAGKTTIAYNIKNKLDIMDKEVIVLDGDDFRAKTKNVDFSKKGRLANLKLAAEYARKEVDQGKIVICAFISPYREFRKMVKGVIGLNKFIEVFVDSPLEVCIKRDVKGLYKKSLNGTLSHFTGMTDPYEPPLTPHIKLDTYRESISKCVDKIITFLFIF